MRKFLQSGAAFMVVALLCIAAGFISKSGCGNELIFGSIGAFWLVMAIIMKARYVKKSPRGDKS